MKLDQLRRMALFAMVAEKGSFTAVAVQQNIATSAVSAAINQLESEVGVRLLHRSTRKISLSDEGQVFFKRCQNMLLEAQTAHEDLNHLTGELAGQLTMTASQTEAKIWLLPAITPLLKQNPKLTLNLLVSDQYLDLVANGIDIAIRSGVLQDSNFIARPLAHLPELIVAAPSYIAQWGLPDNVENLNTHRIIAFSAFAQPQQLKLLGVDGVLHSVQLQVGARTDNVEVVKNLAAQGLGLARLPFHAVEAEIANGQLIQVLNQYAVPQTKTYAVTIKRDLQPPKVIAALQAIQTYMSKIKMP